MSSYYDNDLVGYYNESGVFKPWMNSDYRYSYRDSRQIDDDLRYGKRIYIYRDYTTTPRYVILLLLIPRIFSIDYSISLVFIYIILVTIEERIHQVIIMCLLYVGFDHIVVCQTMGKSFNLCANENRVTSCCSTNNSLA
ncbi:uncharacterized protein DC041_0006028 [Schistosoma bovis]|uniref:Uncharacterized protein n=1 Tax=Schistosoma bovis TaxID=6184 RepID=A0A430QQB2_SCHBO|nr:uncharacterized protein DC041_0006028 [Schistosoma bovis]